MIVPEAERPGWAAGRLAAIGLDAQPESVRIGPLAYAALGGGRRGIPYVEIRALARVTDAAAFGKALVAGTGSGKTYGLGLIRSNPATVAAASA